MSVGPDALAPKARMFRGAVATVAALAATRPAAALAQIPREGSSPPPAAPASYSVELSAQAAYTTPPIRGGTTPFGAGFGAKLGLAFEHLYLGLNGMAYLGGSDIDITDRSLLGGAELGYSFFLNTGRTGGVLTVRPLVGAGGVRILHTDPSLARSTGKTDVVTSASGRSGRGASDTTTLDNVYVQPAIMVMYSSGMPFVAANANVLVIPGVSYSGSTTTWLAYGLQGQVGLRF
jgi:hypothetical protein